VRHVGPSHRTSNADVRAQREADAERIAGYLRRGPLCVSDLRDIMGARYTAERVSNVLQRMRATGRVQHDGARPPRWSLVGEKGATA
jgi:hypothetical protein